MSALSLLFWLFALFLVVFVYFFTSYLIKQHYDRVQTSAVISAKGLANVIDERIEQQRLMVKALALHNKKRIFELAQGGGFPFDVFAISNHIKELLPSATQFAILDAQGEIVVGSDQFHINLMCQSQVKHFLNGFSSSISFLGPHHSPDDKTHYDIVYPLEREGRRAVLFLSFKFDVFQTLMSLFDTEMFEFVLVSANQPTQVIVSAKGVASNELDAILKQEEIKSLLTKTTVLDGKWLLLGIPNQSVLSNYVQQVFWSAAIFLGIFFILMFLLMHYLRKVENSRKRLESDSVQDALFNTGPTVLFQKTADSNMMVKYVSPNVYALLGCNVQEVLNQSSFVDLILLEDVAAVRMAILNAFTHHEQEIGLEYRVQYAQYQGYRWVYDLTRIVYNSQGKPVRLQSYVTSIHAQKMAEQRANRLIESAPDAMAITDRYGVVLRVNQAFEKMFGYNREDLVGLSLDLCIYETSQDSWHQRIQKIMDEESEESVLLGVDSPVMAITREGKTFSVDVGLSRVDSMENVQLVHMIRDISIQISAQKQMQIAKERAESLAKARSRFVATMSHEIRTPLNGVLGMSNLLMSTPLNSQQEIYLQAIEHSGEALLKVVNNILDFAKLDEGGVNLELEAFDLNLVIQDVLQILQLQAQENEVALSFESTLPDGITLFGDAGRVQQVLLNLLSNAIKFSPQGSVDILVKSTFVNSAPTDMLKVLIEVKDTGVGIAEESLGQLFDSFTQADDSTTRKFGGTGLGLTISKQLVELMGGAIGVMSELEVGSLFWVEIPFRFSLPVSRLEDMSSKEKPSGSLLEDLSSQEAFSLSSSTQLMKSNTQPPPLSRALEDKTILLIEDNETNQKIVLAFIQRLGGRVDIAKNGLEGLSFWRMNAQKYDLILMDCQMPVMDGYEATILIRKEEALLGGENAIPIVALTANAMPEDRKRCFSVGMDDYITKPINVELFNQTLIKWINTDVISN
ncbi:sensory box histidine kinase/response regulator [hydrothermal vent metagenome]|uniref:Sensory box histidine kinase/response regulator n=1 Tax=hydrothermal vent metagenome TaxID=652676 RepID=A0A3B0WT55_9ZZZZ